ncbi:MAG: hypothetical protein GY724_22205 [Actinomycetia bacterium]|nr:hypothetical protein [Actinomycetes bacterium]MCP4222804.1 hypothetical protein [Actinomycetes bacterium]MCP5033815.1 hypothetical protein [Actinomycetes bacterium]
MGVGWGIVMIVFSVLAWGGQTLAWLAPTRATRWGLTEAEGQVEPVYHADIRGEARFDAMTLWAMVVAGVLLVAGNGAWAYFGLASGGMYAYFAGRSISTRLEMQRRGFRIGNPQNVRLGYLFLTLWGLVAIVTLVAAAVDLRST